MLANLSASDLAGVLRWVLGQPQGKLAPCLELVCPEHPSPERGNPGVEVIILPQCAARVPVFQVLELLVAGASTITVRLDECTDQGASLAHFEPVTSLLGTAGFTRLTIDAEPPTRARKRSILESQAMPVSRRKLLSLGLARNDQDVCAPDSAQSTNRHPDLSHSDPLRLTVALQNLLGTDPQTLEAISQHTESVSPAIQLVASGCTACNVCVRACPSDALVLTHSATTDTAGNPVPIAISTLSQRPSSCDGCMICVEICPQDALSAAGSWGWAQALKPGNEGGLPQAPITSLTTAQCQRCRTRFPTNTGEPLCQVCSYRRKNPFSSTSPPDFRRDPNAAL